METTRLKISGIKCDNKACDFKDMSVKREDYDTWRNKPCPLCQSNLLTDADYNLMLKMEKASDFINKLFPTKKNNGMVQSQTSIELDGSGFIQSSKTTKIEEKK